MDRCIGSDQIRHSAESDMAPKIIHFLKQDLPVRSENIHRTHPAKHRQTSQVL